MPRINLKNIQMDAVGAAVALVMLAGGYYLLIQPPLKDCMADNALRVEQDKATQAICNLRQAYLGQLRMLEESQQRLLSRATWLSRPDLPEEVLSRINELARQCDVRIIRWQPQSLQALKEYQVQIFSLEGSASGTALLRWFALIEAGVPLLDITHFSVTGPPTPDQNVCEFTCSLKLYLGNEDRVMEVATAQP